MIVIPAIDLRAGRCVRLRQGDYGQETVFSNDPGEVARRFVAQGASYLHVVDLDGAREGRPVNLAAVSAIAAVGVPFELGGGLRQESDLQTAFDAGAEHLVIGTQALRHPDWFAQMAERFSLRLLLGLDANQGRVATDGWQETSEVSAIELARRWEHHPLSGLIYTDISRDGMLAGPNFAALTEMCQATQLPVIASGGVTTLEDVRRVAQLPLAGCIIGRALYEGTLDLKQALEVASAR